MENGNAMIRHPPDTARPAKAVQGLRVRRELRQQYEALLHRLPWPAIGSTRAPKTLGLSSCQSGEGVSTVAAHLALTAAAMADCRVVLVDANFARPCLPRIFGVRGRPGLAEVLEKAHDLAEVLQVAAADNLSLLAAGQPADRRSGIYAAPAWEGLLKELAADFDLVLVDLPAVAESGGALRLGGRLDGVLLVVEAGRVRRDSARRVGEQLVRAGARPLGTILNKWRQDVPAWLSRIL